MMRWSVLVICLGLLAGGRTCGDEQIELLGTLEIPGTALDQSGLTHSLNEAFTNNLLGGFSAVAWSGHDDLYYFLSDRGPLDGAVDWTCRVQSMRIKWQPDTQSTWELVATTLLKNSNDIPFTGMASAFSATDTTTMRFDPEGLRVTREGNWMVSDEYGPHVIEFSPEGVELRRIEMPRRYRITAPGLTKQEENKSNDRGRQGNRGMEGLAVCSDRSVVGLMQSPLIQDCDRSTPGKPVGTNCRMIRINQAGNVASEWIYALDHQKNKLNEILSCGDSLFLVIERDGEAGAEARYKKIMLISSAAATDCRDIERLPARGLPGKVRPVFKRAFIDLLDPQWNLAGSQMPEKIECLAFGPDLKDGRKLLLVASDNDFEPKQPSFVYLFAVPEKLLLID